MDLGHLNIFFQIIVFLLAISVHESAHAWTASYYGDPTARLLGRVSLNPIRHIDPIGTLLLPAIAMIANLPVIGWAKPTPVDPRNFKEPIKADIMTSVAGPVSNFILVAIGMVLLGGLILAVPEGRAAVYTGLGIPAPDVSGSAALPLAMFLIALVEINVILGIFNLIPIPPLDGSHVVRHLLSEPARRIYDSVGMFGLILLVFFGGRFVWALISPVLTLLFRTLLRI